jgi:hypothetical protein
MRPSLSAFLRRFRGWPQPPLAAVWAPSGPAIGRNPRSRLSSSSARAPCRSIRLAELKRPPFRRRWSGFPDLLPIAERLLARRPFPATPDAGTPPVRSERPRQDSRAGSRAVQPGRTGDPPRGVRVVGPRSPSRGPRRPGWASYERRHAAGVSVEWPAVRRAANSPSHATPVPPRSRRGALRAGVRAPERNHPRGALAIYARHEPRRDAEPRSLAPRRGISLDA